MNTEQRSNHPRRTLEVDGVSKRKLATIGGRFGFLLPRLPRNCLILLVPTPGLEPGRRFPSYGF